MPKKSPEHVFVFPLHPEAQRALPEKLAGTLAFYHDRSLYPLVEDKFGSEPRLNDVTRTAVFDAIKAQIEALGLEERLFSDECVGPKAKHAAVRGFITGRTIEDVKTICERNGWILILPHTDATPILKKKKSEARPTAQKRVAEPEAVPPPEIPKEVAAKIARIEALAKKAGAALQKGASNAEISRREAKLKISLPPEVRAFYLAHDGGSKVEPTFGDRYLLSIEGLVEYWESWRDSEDDELDEDAEPDPGVRKKWWHRKWLPITHDAGGNHEMLDLTPAKGGKLGQIISVYHDDGGRALEGPDYLTWLAGRLKAAAKK
jgi:cell wall assembly regulator SMI1